MRTLTSAPEGMRLKAYRRACIHAPINTCIPAGNKAIEVLEEAAAVVVVVVVDVVVVVVTMDCLIAVPDRLSWHSCTAVVLAVVVVVLVVVVALAVALAMVVVLIVA